MAAAEDKFDVLCSAVLEAGSAIHDDFLPLSAVRELVSSAWQRRAAGGFAVARVGTDPLSLSRRDVRGDLIAWIGEPLAPVESLLLTELERLRVQMNRRAYLGLFDLELHYAWYPPGAAYARHVDQPRGSDRRQLSWVLYLNEGWPRDAGGELRLFDAAHQYRDIQPHAGRLVCFSAGREHAVLPARGDRLSIAGWFRRRE